MKRHLSPVCGLLVLLVGCAATPVPVEHVAAAEAAIRAAQEVGAQGNPQAALHLKLAQEQFDKANAFIKDGDTKAAALVLKRSEADAELALALARENATKAEAQQMMDQVQTLKKKGI